MKDGYTFTGSVPITEDFTLVTITLTTGYNYLDKPKVLVRTPGQYDREDVMARLAEMKRISDAVNNGTYVDVETIKRKISGLEHEIEEKLYAAIGCLILPMLWPVSIYFFVERSKLKKELEELRSELQDAE